MVKVTAGRNAFVYPMPVTLLGTLVDGKPDFMALGWVSRVNAFPPMIGCSVGRHHHSVLGIEKNRTFSINCPSADMIQKTDYCGLVSGRETDKSSLFEVFYGETGTAPMISQCPFSLECRLENTIEMATNNFYIGEIVTSFIGEEYLTADMPDIKKINPILLTMPDNRYWTVGEYAGDAWGVGKTFRR